MRRQWKAPAAIAVLLLPGIVRYGAAQTGDAMRSAEVAYDAEMAHEGRDCLDSLTLADGDECLNNVRAETYKNFAQFFAGLRETLIANAVTDAHALALDAAQAAWEQYRTRSCDAVDALYDAGTVKHPGPAGPNARTRCLIGLTRSRMRDLKEIYEPAF